MSIAPWPAQPLAPALAPLPTGTEIAGYQLLRHVGNGAHGSVYLAHTTGGGGLVALKLLPLPAGPTHEAAASEFLRAAQAAQSLQHPDIVRVQRSGITPQGMGWLAMEALSGSDLSRYTHAHRLLPEGVVLDIGCRLAGALAAAHSQGVLHRDVKPANVMVDWPSRMVKLMDFGIARTADSSQTATGMLLGSPAYMAPEQLAGNQPTVHSDLYAFGVTLFELLTGRTPYAASSMGELLRQVAQGEVPDLGQQRPDLPAELSTLVQSLMAKAPLARPSDGLIVAAALRRLRSHWPGAVGSAGSTAH